MNALKSWLVLVTALTSRVPSLHVSWIKMYSSGIMKSLINKYEEYNFFNVFSFIEAVLITYYGNTPNTSTSFNICKQYQVQMQKETNTYLRWFSRGLAKKKTSNDDEKYEYAIHMKGRKQRKRKVSAYCYYNLNIFLIHHVFKKSQDISMIHHRFLTSNYLITNTAPH